LQKLVLGVLLIILLGLNPSCKTKPDEKKDEPKVTAKKNEEVRDTTKVYINPSSKNSKAVYEKIKAFMPDLTKQDEYKGLEYQVDTRNFFIILQVKQSTNKELALWAHIFLREKDDKRRAEYNQNIDGYPAKRYAKGFWGIWVGQFEIRAGCGRDLQQFMDDTAVQNFIKRFNLKELEKLTITSE
jgi:hypothetical protein